MNSTLSYATLFQNEVVVSFDPGAALENENPRIHPSMSNQPRPVLFGCVRTALWILLTLTSCVCHAATWTGPTIGFTQSTQTPADTVLAGSVVLTRGPRDGLYNTAYGETYLYGISPGPYSPTNTEWAFGTLDNLPPPSSFQSLESIRYTATPNFAQTLLFQPMVMHIIKEDIYLSVIFTQWGTHGSGGFAYTRSTPVPTVSITNPVSGVAFAAPANVKLSANASFIGGTVTNVSFFNGANLLGSVQSAPFNLTASNLVIGSYSLTAVATAAGLSGTSAVVNVSVVNPIAVSISGSQTTNGTFTFRYSANPGLSYAIQTSSNIVNWTPVATNTALTNPAIYSEPLAATTRRYYRVARLPNP